MQSESVRGVNTQRVCSASTFHLLKILPSSFIPLCLFPILVSSPTASFPHPSSWSQSNTRLLEDLLSFHRLKNRNMSSAQPQNAHDEASSAAPLAEPDSSIPDASLQAHAPSSITPQPEPAPPHDNEAIPFNDRETMELKDYSCLPVYLLKNHKIPSWHDTLGSDCFTPKHPPQPSVTTQDEIIDYSTWVREARKVYPEGMSLLHIHKSSEPSLQMVAWVNSFGTVRDMIYFVDSIGKPSPSSDPHRH